MRSDRPDRTERGARVHHAGGVLLPTLALAVGVTLAAVLAPHSERLLSTASRAAGLERIDEGLHALRLRHTLPVDPASDLDGPALARAAEAGLQRLRTQFAGTLQAALPEGALEDRLAAVSSALGLDARSRDARNAATVPGTTAAAAGAPPADAPPRVLTLPDGGDVPATGLRDGTATLIGHATVLLQANGFTVLTDPNFLRRGEPARLAPGIAVPRRDDPAIELDALPPIDLVVLSRLRDDHFDRVVQRQLPRDVPIIAPPQARGRLVAMGFESVHALPDWDSLQVAKGSAWVRVTATPTRRGPPVVGALLPASMGSLLEFGRGGGLPGYRLWISGDTHVDATWLDALAARVGDLDLALLHVGGVRLLGVLESSMDPAGAIRTARRLAPRAVVPLTLDDFGGSSATSDAPQRQASIAAAATGPTTRVRMLERGDTHAFGATDALASARGAAPALP